MSNRKSLLEKVDKPNLGRRAKNKIDQFLEENVSTPLSKRGFENLGPALAAAGSSVGELLIPESAGDLAMAAFPAGKIFKVGSRFFKTSAKTGKPVPIAKELVDEAIRGGEKVVDATTDVKRAATKQGKKIDTDSPDFVLDFSKIEKRSKPEIAREEKLKKLKRPGFDYSKTGEIKPKKE